MRRRPLASARLRTAHDTTLRALVQASWDLPDTLPRRSATDISGAALQAARFAEAAARDAADASATARAAAQYARRLAAEREPRLPRKPPPLSTPLARPVRPVPLGKVWSLDLVALPHNAVRLDLADFYDLLAGLLASPCVTLAELSAMFAWFSTFEAFVVTCLKAEEEVLYPWVEQWGRIDGDLSTASRITTKGTIIRGIRDTAACAALVGLHKDPAGMVLTNPDRNYYDGLKVGLAEVAPQAAAAHNPAVLHSSVLQRVADLVSSFSAVLLDYFHEEETSLPVIIESLYDREDMHSGNIERRIVRAMWKCGRKDDCMMMLLRAVENGPFPRLWMTRNLRRLERMAVPFWKRRYNLGRGAVTTKFRQRKTFAQRKHTSVEMSVSGFGEGFVYQPSSANLSSTSSIFPRGHDGSFKPANSFVDIRVPSMNGT